MIDYMRELNGRGRRLAICTNNVREWEARWRAMLPIDEIFDTVVDSAFVGMRKPDPEIYRLTLERLGAAPAEALFVDDVELNCEAAAEHAGDPASRTGRRSARSEPGARRELEPRRPPLVSQH